MTARDGYFIAQHTRSNSISIMLPQRWDTVTNTAAPVVNRRLRLTDDEEAVLLGVIKAMFEGQEGAFRPKEIVHCGECAHSELFEYPDHPPVRVCWREFPRDKVVEDGDSCPNAEKKDGIEKSVTNREWLAKQIKTLPPEDVYDLLRRVLTGVGKEYSDSRSGVAQWLTEERK